MQSEQINELSAGLAKAQGSMKAAAYNRINPHFKSRYADLAAVWEAIREPLSTNGLSVTQTLEPINGMGFYLRTTLYHTSGQWVSSMYPLPAEVTPQQLGSALTYARRYSLSSIVGIAADEDDDANAAQKTPSSRNVMQAAQQKGAGAQMAQKPLAQDLNDEVPDFIAVESGGEAPPVFVAAKPPLKQKNFADAASSAEGAAAVAPSPATGGADLKLQLLYSAAREAAKKDVAQGKGFIDKDSEIQKFFRKRTQEEKEELRKIKTELEALYPK